MSRVFDTLFYMYFNNTSLRNAEFFCLGLSTELTHTLPLQVCYIMPQGMQRKQMQ